MKLQPMRDLMVIKLDEKPSENKSKSGIIIKEAWEQANNTAVVEAVGKLVTQFKPGDHIYFNPYAMIEVSLNKDEKRYFLKEGDVLATL